MCLPSVAKFSGEFLLTQLLAISYGRSENNYLHGFVWIFFSLFNILVVRYIWLVHMGADVVLPGFIG